MVVGILAVGKIGTATSLKQATPWTVSNQANSPSTDQANSPSTDQANSPSTDHTQANAQTYPAIAHDNRHRNLASLAARGRHNGELAARNPFEGGGFVVAKPHGENIVAAGAKLGALDGDTSAASNRAFLGADAADFWRRT